MTKLNKAVTREVEVKGKSYYVSLEPEGSEGMPAIKFKEKGRRGANGECQSTLESILDVLSDTDEQYTVLVNDKQQYVSEKPYMGIKDMEIHPKDLEMWAKCSYSKFQDAWKKYKTMTASSGTTVQILWREEGAIELVHTRTS